MTYGNGLFVAVAYSGTGTRVMTSPDGITWTTRTSAADNLWYGVTYGNGLFVAVARSGTGDRVMTSPDGITWTIRASAADHDWRSVTYGGGLFVAVAWSGVGNRVMTNGTFDATAPNAPTITAGPTDASTTTDPDPAFSFSATDDIGGTGIASYECRLDTPAGTGTWTTCSSPKAFTALTDGTHTFNVRAIDGAGNTSATTARSWQIDATAPNAPSITAGPTDGSTTADTDPSFSFTATDTTGGTGIASYQCRLDTPTHTGTWTTCTSPKRHTLTTNGTHTFNVRAVDGAGNTGAATAQSWRLDTTAPRTRLINTVPTYLSATAVTLLFSADQADATYRCRVNNGRWEACTSPARFTLDEGAHSLLVQAVSRTGVSDPDPVSVTVVIDRTPPRTELEETSIPGEVTSDPGFRGRLRASEPGVRFECRLNTDAWAACPSQPHYDGLAEGEQTFAARAIDRAGNIGPETTNTWELRAARKPLTIESHTGKRALVCSAEDITGATSIDYQWHRNNTALKTTTDRYKPTGRDDGSRLTCTATATYASGATTRYTAPPILIDRGTRLTNFTTTTTTHRAPTTSFRVNKKHLVLIRLWCRSTTRTCQAPTKPLDHQPRARASYIPAGLTKYRRVITHAKKGTNRINLKRFLPKGLPPGDYKLTIRLARKTKTGRHTTTNFLRQRFHVKAP